MKKVILFCTFLVITSVNIPTLGFAENDTLGNKSINEIKNNSLNSPSDSVITHSSNDSTKTVAKKEQLKSTIPLDKEPTETTLPKGEKSDKKEEEKPFYKERQKLLPSLEDSSSTQKDTSETKEDQIKEGTDHETNDTINPKKGISSEIQKQESEGLSFFQLFFNLIIILGAIALVVFQTLSNRKLKNENSKLKDKLMKSKNTLKRLNEQVQISKFNNTSKNQINETKVNLSIEDKKRITEKVTKEIIQSNKLNKEELNLLIPRENRWVSLGHSAIGLNHTKASPIIPCQDNNHLEDLNNGFQLLIVCDGAGSAKKSDNGSRIIAKEILPKLIKEINFQELVNSVDEKNKKWQLITKSLLLKSKDLLSKQIGKGENLNDYACTVIGAIFNKDNIFHFHIGDGRGGFLNLNGEFMPLFNPTNGEESNSTVFLTSDIVWNEPEEFIESGVIKDKILSVFLLSDGMEEACYECSKFENNLFVDPNIPFKNFFLPILKKIKETPIEHEEKLQDHWKVLLEKGNPIIENQADDKTLVLSFIK